MEKGLVFSLFAAIGFAASIVTVRKATARTGESFTATAISAFIGIPFFAIALSFSGEWSKLLSVSGRVFILLGVVGIMHFVAGRMLGYISYRLIGANKATPFNMTAPFYTVILSVLFLKESVTVFLILGVLCVFTGAALTTTERKSVSQEKQNRFFGKDFKGILAALGAGILWGITPVLIKPAISEIGSPVVGAFVSYVVASIVMAFFFLQKQHRQQMVQPIFFTALILLIISGLFAAIGQIFLFTALRYSPADMVAPLMSTQALFIPFFSLLLNRQIEIFTPKVIVGMAATVVGTFLIFQ